MTPWHIGGDEFHVCGYYVKSSIVLLHLPATIQLASILKHFAALWNEAVGIEWTIAAVVNKTIDHHILIATHEGEQEGVVHPHGSKVNAYASTAFTAPWRTRMASSSCLKDPAKPLGGQSLAEKD